MLSTLDVNRVLERLCPSLADAPVAVVSSPPASGSSQSPSPAAAPPPVRPRRSASGIRHSTSPSPNVANATALPVAASATVPRRRVPLAAQPSNSRPVEQRALPLKPVIAQQPQMQQPQFRPPQRLVVRETAASAARRRRNEEQIALAARPRTFFGARLVESELPARRAASAPPVPQQRQPPQPPQPQSQPQQQREPAPTEQPRVAQQPALAALLDRIATPPQAPLPSQNVSVGVSAATATSDTTAATTSADGDVAELIHMSAGSIDPFSLSPPHPQPQPQQRRANDPDLRVRQHIQRQKRLQEQALRTILAEEEEHQQQQQQEQAQRRAASSSLSSARERTAQLLQQAVSSAQDSASKRRAPAEESDATELEQQALRALSYQEQQQRQPSGLQESLRTALRSQPMTAHDAMMQSLHRELCAHMPANQQLAAMMTSVALVHSVEDMNVAMLMPTPVVLCVPVTPTPLSSSVPVDQLLSLVCSSQQIEQQQVTLHSHGSTFICLRRAPGRFLVWYFAAASSRGSAASALLASIAERWTQQPLFEISLFWRSPHSGRPEERDRSSGAVSSDVWWRAACDAAKVSVGGGGGGGAVLHDADLDVDSAIGQLLLPAMLSAGVEEAAVQRPQSLLLGCGIEVTFLHVQRPAGGSSRRGWALRCLLAPFEPTYALWRRSPESGAADAMMTTMSVVLAHDASARVVSFAKAVCQGGLSNFGIVSGAAAAHQQQLHVAANASGATLVDVSAHGQGPVAVIQRALTVASERLWRGVVVQLPRAASSNSAGAGDALMNALCRWPFEFPSVVVIVSESSRLDDFASVLDAFEALPCEAIVDRLLV